jgi:hypothetical protein
MENRQQALYWAELVELKVAWEYIRPYRDSLAFMITRFAVIRAVVSVSTPGTWAAVKSYPMVWGGIIAAAQVADALQNAIPFAARFRGTNALSATLDTLFIDRPMAWEDIFGGRLDESEIIKRRHRIMTLRHEAEAVLRYKPWLRAKAQELAGSSAFICVHLRFHLLRDELLSWPFPRVPRTMFPP